MAEVVAKGAARYPTRAQIARALQAARENGICVTALDICPNGVIRLGQGALADTATGSLFDQLDLAGRL